MTDKKTKGIPKHQRMRDAMMKGERDYSEEQGLELRVDAASTPSQSKEVSSPSLEGEYIPGEVILTLDCHDIDPNPYQNRRYFSPDALAELAESIRQNGQNQPIVVRKFGAKYQIIFGERRWRACSMLPSKTVKAVVRQATDIEMIYLCASENSSREKIYDYERCNTIQDLLDKHEPIEKITARLGIGKQDYYKILKFNDLDDSVKDALNSYPKALSRNEASDLSSMMNSVDVENLEQFNEDLVDLINQYRDGKIKSRAAIIKQLRAKHVVVKSRNRPKVNSETSIESNGVKVGSVIETPSEFRLFVDKSEVSEDVVRELREIVSNFLISSESES